jgi:IstB-like ATP binding protein
MARKAESQGPLPRCPPSWSASTSPRRRAAFKNCWPRAETTQPAYPEFLCRLLEVEQGSRWERRLQRRRRWSELSPPLSLEGFDWAARPQLSRQVVKEPFTCRFIDEHRRVILVGRPPPDGAGARPAARLSPVAQEPVDDGPGILARVSGRSLP